MTLQLPPEALAALTEPCQTCDGRRWHLSDDTPGPYDAVPCPDCADRVVYVNVRSAWVQYDDLENAWVDDAHGNPVRRVDLDHTGFESTRIRHVAPPEWVKLAEATCETCVGFGTLADRDLVPTKPCPDCHEGKPIHVVSVPCGWCAGDGWLMGEPDHYERGTDAWLQCECNPNGDDPFVSPTVEVKVIVLELVESFGFGATIPRYPSVEIWSDGSARLHLARNEWSGIPVVGPELKPGDHIVVIKVAS